MIKITRVSPFTGKENTMDINCTMEQLNLWRNEGQLIQYAMPDTTAEQREFLITGMSEEEQKEIYG